MHSLRAIIKEREYMAMTVYTLKHGIKIRKLSDTTKPYIDAHFNDITEFGSAIESRLDDSDCSLSGLKEDNKQCLEGFVQAGEQVELIDDCFERAIDARVED